MVLPNCVIVTSKTLCSLSMELENEFRPTSRHFLVYFYAFSIFYIVTEFAPSFFLFNRKSNTNNARVRILETRNLSRERLVECDRNSSLSASSVNTSFENSLLSRISPLVAINDHSNLAIALINLILVHFSVLPVKKSFFDISYSTG